MRRGCLRSCALLTPREAQARRLARASASVPGRLHSRAGISAGEYAERPKDCARQRTESGPVQKESAYSWSAPRRTSKYRNVIVRRGRSMSICPTSGANGTGSQTITCTAADLPNGAFIVNKASGTATLASNLVLNGLTQALTITSGTLDLAGKNLSVTGALSIGSPGTLKLEGGETLTYGSVSPESGSTVLYSGSGTYTSLAAGGAYDNLTFNGTGSWQQAATISINGNLTITQGTLNSNGKNITLAGDWSNSGTYTSGSNTVTLSGSSQSILGSNTLSTLIKSATSACTLTFENSKTQTISGTLQLNGAPGNKLSLRSNLTGTQWSINPQGTRRLLSLDVKDSNNTNATAMAASTTSTDSGNNTNWTFNTTYALVWSGGGANNNWNTAGNWQGGAVPGSSDIALFDGTSNKNATINVASSVLGLFIDSAYTGTITQSSGIALTVGTTGMVQSGSTYNGSSGAITNSGPLSLYGGTLTASSGAIAITGNWTQSAGTFTGSSGSVTVSSNLALSGGTLTAPSGTFSVAGNWNKSGGTFTPGSNTVTFNKASGTQTLDSGASSFYNLTHSGAGTLQLISNALTLTNNFTNFAGTFDTNSQNMTVSGNWTRSAGTFLAGSTTITLSGSANQSLDGGSSQTFGTIAVSKSGGALTFANNGFTGTTLSVAAGNSVKFQSTKTFALTNLTLSGAAGNLVALRATEDYNFWSLNVSGSGSQTISYVDVKSSNAKSGAIIDGTNNCTDSGLNANWDFGAAPTFQYATSYSANLTKIYCRFDQAMDSTTSTNTANWSVSGGLTVNAASISSDKKRVTLTASGNVTLGTTTVNANSSIKSLVNRNLSSTTLTIQDGTSNGIPTAQAVTVSLSTDGNQSVVFQGPTFTFTGVPASVGEVLTVTAPGTTATTVNIGPVMEPGGTSQFLLDTSGTATTATLTTSGGTPNSASIAVRYSVQSTTPLDSSLRAYVAGAEAGLDSLTAHLSPRSAPIQQPDRSKAARLQPHFRLRRQPEPRADD
jgi:formylmethanofuran dehydrogenase subunit C